MIDDSRLAEAVRAKVEALQAELLAKVQANLSGDVLQARSGALEASVAASTAVRGSIFEAMIASDGVPYAAIQEHGGVTPPHAILPVKAQALALVGGGFPGASRIQARSSRGAATWRARSKASRPTLLAA